MDAGPCDRGGHREDNETPKNNNNNNVQKNNSTRRQRSRTCHGNRLPTSHHIYYVHRLSSSVFFFMKTKQKTKNASEPERDEKSARVAPTAVAKPRQFAKPHPSSPVYVSVSIHLHTYTQQTSPRPRIRVEPSQTKTRQDRTPHVSPLFFGARALKSILSEHTTRAKRTCTAPFLPRDKPYTRAENSRVVRRMTRKTFLVYIRLDNCTIHRFPQSRAFDRLSPGS